jgi:hypothetical protein
MPDSSEPPEITFRCRVARGHVPLFSPGTVTITTEAVRCEFNPVRRGLLGRDVVHRSRTVAVVRVWLMPPSWGKLLELVGERGERVYATPNFGWGVDVETDLRLRGYTVVEPRRWVL